MRIIALLTMGMAVMAMGTQKKLSLYKKRRNLESSGEPLSKKVLLQHPIYVIQKHDASHLHYDFRLEIENVLVSWAVPKGPSTDPKEKRLAIRTDDHPLSYAQFEGVIPKGNYGAGTVMVWDYGIFKNIKYSTKTMKQSLRDGQIEVFLEGEKLQGGYVLIRIDDKDEKWLLKKINDAYACKPKNPLQRLQRSALTNRTLTQIASDKK